MCAQRAIQKCLSAATFVRRPRDRGMTSATFPCCEAEADRSSLVGLAPRADPAGPRSKSAAGGMPRAGPSARLGPGRPRNLPGVYALRIAWRRPHWLRVEPQQRRRAGCQTFWVRVGPPNALVQLQAHYRHCGEAASEKCLSAATFVSWRGQSKASLCSRLLSPDSRGRE